MTEVRVITMYRETLRLSIDGRHIDIDGEVTLRRANRTADFRANMDVLSTWVDGEPIKPTDRIRILLALRDLEKMGEIGVELEGLTRLDVMSMSGIRPLGI